MIVWAKQMTGVSLVCVASNLLVSTAAVARSKGEDSGSKSNCVADRMTNGELRAESKDIPVLEVAPPGTGLLAPCPPITVSYTLHQFTSGSFVAQGGMVTGEIAAVSYTIDPSHFPIRIDRVDVLVGTLSLANQVTERWSVLVWQGDPNTGTLVYTIQSDGKNPPHIIASPPTNAVYLQASVDPQDPEQIIVTNNGSNRFSVGYRIDQHHLGASTSCPCVPSVPSLGTYPAICCPPPSSLNLFPASDTDGLSQSSRNWLFARNCPGATGFCDPAGGWFTSSQAGISGDWIIRAVYTPSGCVPATGACCVASGSCFNGLTAAQCQAQSGTYQGDNTNCSSINCPVPTGGCCLNGGQTCSVLSQNQCTAQGGTFLGVNVVCGANSCRGACCIQSSQTCLNTIQNSCTGANTFSGIGTACATFVCFPIGACCLPSGACASNVSPAQCQAQGGVFQGNTTLCQNVNCPVPNGSCCIGTECFEQVTAAECLGALGTWNGPNSVCSPNPCGAQPCVGDDNLDNIVNIDDLVRVITNWGACVGCVPPGNCIGDINDNCVVNIDDLVQVITHWGACP